LKTGETRRSFFFSSCHEQKNVVGNVSGVFCLSAPYRGTKNRRARSFAFRFYAKLPPYVSQPSNVLLTNDCTMYAASARASARARAARSYPAGAAAAPQTQRAPSVSSSFSLFVVVSFFSEPRRLSRRFAKWHFEPQFPQVPQIPRRRRRSA
jgi:hypothetical protein